MIQVQQKDDVEPLCPHCSEPVRTMWFQELQTTFGKRYLYFCSACRKVLGVSHRKGFWMG